MAVVHAELGVELFGVRLQHIEGVEQAGSGLPIGKIGVEESQDLEFESGYGVRYNIRRITDVRGPRRGRSLKLQLAILSDACGSIKGRTG
jgi:hypothetical protein